MQSYAAPAKSLQGRCGLLPCLPSFQPFSFGNSIPTFHQHLRLRWASPPPAAGRAPDLAGPADLCQPRPASVIGQEWTNENNPGTSAEHPQTRGMRAWTAAAVLQHLGGHPQKESGRGEQSREMEREQIPMTESLEPPGSRAISTISVLYSYVRQFPFGSCQF